MKWPFISRRKYEMHVNLLNSRLQKQKSAHKKQLHKARKARDEFVQFMQSMRHSETFPDYEEASELLLSWVDGKKTPLGIGVMRPLLSNHEYDCFMDACRNISELMKKVG